MYRRIKFEDNGRFDGQRHLWSGIKCGFKYGKSW